MDDFLNSAESKLVTFCSANGRGDLTSVAKYIHEKVLDNPQHYQNNQLPAVGIYATGYIGDENDRHNDGIRIYFEITDFGKAMATMDSNVKKLVAMIVNNLRRESPQLDQPGRGIDGTFDDVFVVNADVFPMDVKNTGLMIRAGIDVELYFVADK